MRPRTVNHILGVPAMSANLVKVLVALTKAAPVAGNAAIVSTSVVVTDSSGVPQAVVLFTAADPPTPGAFPASVLSGNRTAVPTDLSAGGSTVGTPVPLAFP